MNLLIVEPHKPLRVLVTNPHSTGAEAMILKIMYGTVFGATQRIDLILLVYDNEKHLAEKIKVDIEACAYYCTNSVRITSEIPRITDADVFCFITNFPNPDYINLTEPITDPIFDSFYLLLKIANNFSKYPYESGPDEIVTKKGERIPIPKQKPLFIADGLLALDVLMTFADNIPPDCLFCPTSISTLARDVLSKFLEVSPIDINIIQVWAANNTDFYICINYPVLVYDELADPSKGCIWSLMSRSVYKEKNLETTTFNSYWLRSVFQEKVRKLCMKNPFGPMYRATRVARNLKKIWSARNGETVCNSYGVISDGSFGFFKGCPCVMPIIINGDTWKADKFHAECPLVRAEAKIINVILTEQHKKLKTFCKKFLLNEVFQKKFVDACRSSDIMDHTFDMSLFSEPHSTTEATETKDSDDFDEDPGKIFNNPHLADKQNNAIAVTSYPSTQTGDFVE